MGVIGFIDFLMIKYLLHEKCYTSVSNDQRFAAWKMSYTSQWYGFIDVLFYRKWLALVLLWKGREIGTLFGS